MACEKKYLEASLEKCPLQPRGKSRPMRTQEDGGVVPVAPVAFFRTDGVPGDFRSCNFVFLLDLLVSREFLNHAGTHCGI